MNCLIPGPNVKVLAKAIHALAKVGDELFIEARTDKLTFLTFNQAKTICGQMHLLESFFSIYDIESNEQTQNLPICCKIHVKSILHLFKGTQLDKKLESIKMEFGPNSDTIQFKLKYKIDDIILSQVFRLMEPEMLALDDYSGSKNSHISAGSAFYNNLLVLFSNSDDDITLEIAKTKMIARNYCTGAPHKPKSIRSQVTLNSSEFSLYRISEDTTINFPLKPLRAAITFADFFNLNVGLDFDKGGSPICIVLKNPTFEMLFIVSTFNPYADGQSSVVTTESLPTKMNQANKGGGQHNLTQDDLLVIANENWQTFDEGTDIFRENHDGEKHSKTTPKLFCKERSFNDKINVSKGPKQFILRGENDSPKSRDNSISESAENERIKLAKFYFKGAFESQFESFFEGNVILRESDSE